MVISTAIPKTNPELLQARRRSIPVIPRAAALAWILEGSRSIAVAGTHGKTTTTSMTAHVLEALGENPTALVGGELNDIGSNVAFGRSDLVVAEADESDRSLPLPQATGRRGHEHRVRPPRLLLLSRRCRGDLPAIRPLSARGRAPGRLRG